MDVQDHDLGNSLTICVFSEWYGLHFPELVKIVNDNAQYAKCVQIIKSRAQFTDEQVPALEEVFTETPSKGKDIFNAAKTSMGADISQYDLDSIWSFSERVIKLTDYRKHLHDYLLKKMNDIAPNLSALIGEMVGARLIAHAGSLTNLAKYPASTVQILGAEKALFRALKTRGNTPKYGLIFNSSFIGRAKAKDKGRISRYLANKCSIAARIDSFLDYPTTKFGEKLKEQVEERLKFYETGVAPQKNVDVMKSAIEAVKAETDKMQVDGENGGSEKKNKKRKKPEGDDEEEEKKEKKKAKKDKKEKRKSKSKNE
jgi:nucleolar protein 56